MPIQMFVFPNYYAIVLAVQQRLGVLLVCMPNLIFLLSKLGLLVKIKLILIS